MMMISNSNWTEWSIIQGGNAWVISKSDERKAQDWFEITSMIVTKAMGIQLQISNYKKFKLDACNWTPTWWHAIYVTNRCTENQSWSIILL